MNIQIRTYFYALIYAMQLAINCKQMESLNEMDSLEFELTQQKETIFSIQLFSKSKKMLLSSPHCRRLFELHSEGIREDIKIMNEYGVNIGSLHFRLFQPNAGVVKVCDNTYSFKIAKYPNKKMFINIKHTNQIALQGTLLPILSHQLIKTKELISYFCLATCWYFAQPKI